MLKSIRNAYLAARAQARQDSETIIVAALDSLRESLRVCGAHVESNARPSVVLRIARARLVHNSWLSAPLARFEWATLPALQTYVALAGRREGDPDLALYSWAAYIHLGVLRESPVDPNPLKRVVLCVQHTYRAWRKAQRDQGTDRR